MCLIYLTLAIGRVSQMASTSETVREVASDGHFEAEVFFRSAKALGDPVLGFENGDLWCVQALVLMAVYQMLLSGCNAAYMYIGGPFLSYFSRLFGPNFPQEQLRGWPSHLVFIGSRI